MSIRTIAGDCLVHFDGRRERTVRGRVVALLKPDNTVLVHDTDGYQPVAWLTRPESLSVTRDPLWLLASDGEETLRIEAVGDVAIAEHDATDAGTPVGPCRCGGALIRSGTDVTCLGCADRFGLPSGASMTDAACSCGLPRFRIDRGGRFELCLDYECGSLLEAARERFDREWTCPNCSGDLRILRRGGIIVGCEGYPDCETGFVLPDGRVTGSCDCGLPVFELPNGPRCLDVGCSATGNGA
ncbi:endonuclease NucS domain-containing protein [Natronomonas sp. LN261]|jgi:DNA topoisomerase-1|uniref:endonuclease NucS domain-containing protein n=1 Tax=Natronomonas sp. LN261 TaxID=2750669 RepID=UPI0015EF63B1|nr:endonuclease NucS domain-containing protein [Natronomonas sp. LN261]